MFSSIAAYHQQLKSGSTTCLAAVDYYLDRIREQARLNAFVQVYDEEARERARQLDLLRANGETPGPLHGVVLAIKDVICYKDHPVTAASKILEGFTSVYNATAVERLLAAGAIIIGSCNCDEFAMGSTNENSSYGKVLNAIDTTRVPGGSSGGSAVAVQAGMCMLSLGSDTGGSVRQPADFCGILGMKPTYGRISRYGLIAYASSFDQIGIFGNTIADLALALEVMAGADEYDSTAIETEMPWRYSEPVQSHSTYRLAYFAEALEHPSVDTEIREAIQEAIANLRSAGHVVEPVAFKLLEHVVPAYYVLTTAEASSNLSRFDGVRYGYRTKVDVGDLTEFYKRTRSEGFGLEVQRRILLGTFVLSAGYYDAYFGKAQQVRKLLIDQTKAIFQEYDAILLPTSPATAFPIGEKTEDPIAMYLADIFTVFANLTGIPGISLPLFSHSNGMPFGMQVLTAREDESTMFHLSEMLMRSHRKYEPVAAHA